MNSAVCIQALHGAKELAWWPADRAMARFNTAFYSVWTGVSATRGVAFFPQIAQFLKETVAIQSIQLPTVFTSIANVSHELQGLGALTATVEIVLTLGTFSKACRDLFARVRARNDLQPARIAFSNEIALRRKQGRLSARAAGTGATSPAEDVEALADMARRTFAYEHELIKLERSRQALHSESITFVRDAIAQGGGVGCQLAKLIATCGVQTAVDIFKTSVAGPVFSIASGVGHIVAGVVAISNAIKTGELSMAALLATRQQRAQLKALGPHASANDVMRRLLERKAGERATAARADKYVAHAAHSTGIQKALHLSRRLLKLADHNEQRCQDKAAQEKRIGWKRVAYGAATVVLSGLTFALTIALVGNPLGASVLAVLSVASLLASAIWVGYASYRNWKKTDIVEPPKKLALSVETAMAWLSEPSEGENENMRLENALARKLVKATLIDMGLSPTHLRDYKLACHLGLRDQATDFLKFHIDNLLNGDGMRHAENLRQENKWSA